MALQPLLAVGEFASGGIGGTVIVQPQGGVAQVRGVHTRTPHRTRLVKQLPGNTALNKQAQQQAQTRVPNMNQYG